MPERVSESELGSPFKPERKKLDFGDNFGQFFTEVRAGGIDRIIRRHSFQRATGLFDIRMREENPKTADVLSVAKQVKKAYKDLEGFGIKIPKLDIVLGRENIGFLNKWTKDPKSFFTIADKVTGLDLFDVGSKVFDKFPEEEKARFVAEFKVAVNSFIAYLTHILKDTPEFYWHDLKMSQFVWGITGREPKAKHLYMVDVGLEGLAKLSRDVHATGLIFSRNILEIINSYGPIFGIDFSEEEKKIAKLTERYHLFF